MSNEISKILNPDEKIIWQGRPQFRPFILGILLSGGTVFAVLWIAVISFMMFTILTQGPTPWFVKLFFTPFVLFGLYLLFIPLYAWLVYKYIHYAITDKRVIFQSGLVGRDFGFIDFDKIDSATVAVDVIDKLFGKNSGSLMIAANQSAFTTTAHGRASHTDAPHSLAHITDPYRVFEMFKKVSFDVKTDINFPNVLRPKKNVGYQTEYKR